MIEVLLSATAPRTARQTRGKLFSEGINEALEFDPFAEAEAATGKSYKDDKLTEALGMAMHLDHVKNKQAVLELAGDTHMSSTLEQYLSVVDRLGFTKVLEVPFHYTAWGYDDIQLFFWKDGILMKLDSFMNRESVNSTKCYFNWVPHDGRVTWGHKCLDYMSGGWEETNSDVGCLHQKDGKRYVAVISFDAREGLAHHIRALESEGRFISPWVDRPFLWLLHYEDECLLRKQSNSGLHERINAERIAMLPEYVRTALS